MHQYKVPPRKYSKKAQNLPAAQNIPTLSKFSIIINPNVYAPENSEKFAEWSEKLENIIYDDILGVNEHDTVSRTEGLDIVFGPAHLVPEVELRSLGIESGDKVHHIHLHMTVIVKHYIPTYSAGKLRARFANWLDQNHPLNPIKYIKKKEYDQGIRVHRQGKWLVKIKDRSKDSVNPGENYDNKRLRRKKLLEVYQKFPEEVRELTVERTLRKNKQTGQIEDIDLLADELQKAAL